MQQHVAAHPPSHPLMSLTDTDHRLPCSAICGHALTFPLLTHRYRGTEETVRATAGPDGKVLLVAGVVFMCPSTAEDLLALTITHPINACTYLGVDDGAEPFQLCVAPLFCL